MSSVKYGVLTKDDIDRVVGYIKQTYGVDVSKRGRKGELVFLRQIAFYFLSRKFKCTLHKLCDMFPTDGNSYDHSTAIHSKNVVSSDIELGILNDRLNKIIEVCTGLSNLFGYQDSSDADLYNAFIENKEDFKKYLQEQNKSVTFE